MKKRNQTSDAMDSKDRNWDFKKIMKDIEFLGIYLFSLILSF